MPAGPRFPLATDALPSALLLPGGHNPLTLLHTATSECIHELSDEECLERATAIRNVLLRFGERLDMIFHDKHEIAKSVARLLNPPKGKPSE